jgi:hypothetical protein
MDRLESCYFCGTGDGSLDEYPVVPASLSPTTDEQAAVTLCPDCRQKLATVVKRIEAVAADQKQPPSTPDRSADAGGIDDIASPPEPPDLAEIEEDEPDDNGEAESDEPIDRIDVDEPGETEGAEVGEGESDADEEPSATPPETLSPFQYNKVMRLLENRDFPVAIAEFEAIATNAYQLEPSDVEAVIEAAIDRGLIERGEDGETLVRPG